MNKLLYIWVGVVVFLAACGVRPTDKYPTIEDDARLQNLNKRLCESKGKVWNNETNTCEIKL